MSSKEKTTNGGPSDVRTQYLIQADQHRVYFYTLSGVGFSLAELETLKRAIAAAKTHLQEKLTACQPPYQLPVPVA